MCSYDVEDSYIARQFNDCKYCFVMFLSNPEENQEKAQFLIVMRLQVYYS